MRSSFWNVFFSNSISFQHTCSTTRYATPGRSFSSRSMSTTPVSKQRLRLSKEWNDKEATWGRPHLSAPSSTSSSYLIQRAVSFHSRSSPAPCNSSSWTKTSWGLRSIAVRLWAPIMFWIYCSPSFLGPLVLGRRIPRGSSDRCEFKSSKSASSNVESSGWMETLLPLSEPAWRFLSWLYSWSEYLRLL